MPQKIGIGISDFRQLRQADQLFVDKSPMIRDTPEFKAHQGRYPVIFLTFKDIKKRSFDDALRALSTLPHQVHGQPAVILIDENIVFPELREEPEILWSKTPP